MVATAVNASEAGAADLVTDRPGNGNAATTVAPLRFQVETGVLYGWTDEATDVHQVVFPVALRLGLLPWLEGRVLSGLVGVEASGPTESVEATDTAVGAKVGLLSNDGVVPDLALMTDIFLPSGGGSFTADVVVPEVRAAFSWSLPARFGLFANLGFDVPEEGSGRIGRLLHLAQLNYAIPIGAQQLALFAETFGKAAFEGDSGFFQIDAGVLWLLTSNLQLDVFTQHRVSGPIPDFQASLGFSFRI